MNENKNNKRNVELTFDRALRMLRFAELLQRKRKRMTGMKKPMLKSGHAIYFLVKEEPKVDSNTGFIPEMKIASREADKTDYRVLKCFTLYVYPVWEKLLKLVFSNFKTVFKILVSAKSKNYLFIILLPNSQIKAI